MPHGILWSSNHHFCHRAILDERMSTRRPFRPVTIDEIRVRLAENARAEGEGR